MDSASERGRGAETARWSVRKSPWILCCRPSFSLSVLRATTATPRYAQPILPPLRWAAASIVLFKGALTSL